MKKINLQNIFGSQEKKIEGGSVWAMPVHFVRDWKIMVSIFAGGLILLSLFAWRIYLSNRIAGGYLTPSTESNDLSLKTIDQKRLEADLLLLENKQTEFLKTKASGLKPIDPSL